MKNLNRMTNYFNKLEAWRDWRHIAYQAYNAGRADLVVKYAPPEDAGWRIIDKHIAAVRKALNEARKAQA